jgi:hypothetical protein
MLIRSLALTYSGVPLELEDVAASKSTSSVGGVPEVTSRSIERYRGKATSRRAAV